jgi:ATP-dependent Clp protease adaptor protein ClpS
VVARVRDSLQVYWSDVGVLGLPAINFLGWRRLLPDWRTPFVTAVTIPDSTTTETTPVDEVRTRRQPPYHVILENDDHHSMQFVVEVLQKALGCSVERAIEFMIEAHTGGRAVVWTGSREVAELKAEQIQTFPEKTADGRDLGPLGCYIEPAPGG